MNLVFLLTQSIVYLRFAFISANWFTIFYFKLKELKRLKFLYFQMKMYL